jgi:hypothetical protein
MEVFDVRLLLSEINTKDNWGRLRINLQVQHFQVDSKQSPFCKINHKTALLEVVDIRSLTSLECLVIVMLQERKVHAQTVVNR